MTHKAIFGIFRSRKEIRAAVGLLNRLGFADAKATILFPASPGAQDFPQVQKSELLKFARIGSLFGAVLFFVAAVLVVSGVVPLRGLSDSSQLGAVFTILSGIFLGGLVGAACGALIGIGTPDRVSRRYGQYVHAGGILLSVHSDEQSEQKQIEDIFEKTGAQDIASVDEVQGWADVMHEKEDLKRVNLSHWERLLEGQNAQGTLSSDLR